MIDRKSRTSAESSIGNTPNTSTQIGQLFRILLKKAHHMSRTVGGIAHICFKQWFQITADAHPGVSGVSKDQKLCEKFNNTNCQVDHPAKIE